MTPRYPIAARIRCEQAALETSGGTFKWTDVMRPASGSQMRWSATGRDHMLDDFSNRCVCLSGKHATAYCYRRV
jgi:hypothetical protein